MPNAALNNITAPDQYTGAATIDTGGWVDWVNLDVVNAAIYWQVKQASRKYDTAAKSTWQAEVFMLPGSRTINRPGITGIRIRAAIALAQLPAGSHQAQVTAEVVQ